MTKQAIGILGGTFDPIHFGHLRTALEVAQQLNLDHIRLIPNNIPPHREQPKAGAQQRMLMLHLAIKSSDKFVVDDRELQREGPSYMVDTLESLRAEFPENPLHLIMGTDAFNSLTHWHQWQRLIELAHIVVMKRPDEVINPDGEIADFYKAHMSISEDQALLCGKIYTVEVSQLAISSTQIRQDLSQGLSAQFLVPDGVLQVIEQIGLYKA